MKEMQCSPLFINKLSTKKIDKNQYIKCIFSFFSQPASYL